MNEHWFMTMAHARGVMEAWRVEYNTERPHSSLGNQTPEQFANKTPELLPPSGRETAVSGRL
jgi:transposase InsO family protein